jgi:hypothetical protein
MKSKPKIAEDKGSVKIYAGKMYLKELVSDQSGPCQVGSDSIVTITNYNEFIDAVVGVLAEEDDKGESIISKAISEAVLQAINYGFGVSIKEEDGVEELPDLFERGAFCG